MQKFVERGYIVKENGPVYFTLDMDKTVKWFEDILDWYSEIDERNTCAIYPVLTLESEWDSNTERWRG